MSKSEMMGSVGNESFCRGDKAIIEYHVESFIRGDDPGWFVQHVVTVKEHGDKAFEVASLWKHERMVREHQEGRETSTHRGESRWRITMVTLKAQVVG